MHGVGRCAQAFARRPCHELPACLPSARSIFGSSALGSAARDSLFAKSQHATFAHGGVRLLDGAQRQASIFYQPTATLLEGFTSTFSFTVLDLCTDGPLCGSFSIGCCDLSNLGGGFAFVLQAEADGAPVGADCDARVYSYLPSDSALAYTLRNWTQISCAGYHGIRQSLGVVFSMSDNQYWTALGSLISSLDDRRRDSISAYINGDVRDSDSSFGAVRGLAQVGTPRRLKEGTHTVRVVYSAPMQMLYVYLDDDANAMMKAAISPTDLGLEADAPVRVGFTASSKAAMAVDVFDWQVGATEMDAARSFLEESGEVAGRVGEAGFVTIDTRDSCGLPMVQRGVQWDVEIFSPSGEGVAIERVRDLGDGTYRVHFVPSSPGSHRLEAAPLTALSQRVIGSFDVLAHRDRQVHIPPSPPRPPGRPPCPPSPSPPPPSLPPPVPSRPPPRSPGYVAPPGVPPVPPTPPPPSPGPPPSPTPFPPPPSPLPPLPPPPPSPCPPPSPPPPPATASVTFCAVGASIRGNHESSFFDSADWFAELFLCDQGGSLCNRKCTSQTVGGEDVSWNFCCDLGSVTSGQYARIDVWDDDTFSSDGERHCGEEPRACTVRATLLNCWWFESHPFADLGGRVLIKLEPGGFIGRGTFDFTELGDYTEAGSSVVVSVAADWNR